MILCFALGIANIFAFFSGHILIAILAIVCL